MDARRGCGRCRTFASCPRCTRGDGQSADRMHTDIAHRATLNRTAIARRNGRAMPLLRLWECAVEAAHLLLCPSALTRFPRRSTGASVFTGARSAAQAANEISTAQTGGAAPFHRRQCRKRSLLIANHAAHVRAPSMSGLHGTHLARSVLRTPECPTAENI